MPNLTCPMCDGPLDLVRGPVSRQRTYPLTLLRDNTVMVVDRVERTADFVACSRCEYAETVAGVHAASAALEVARG